MRTKAVAKKHMNGIATPGLKIEDGVPLPTDLRKRTTGITAVMRQMKPGQSVLLPQYRTTLNAGAARMAARLLGPEGFQFTMRTVEGGVRVWRLS